MPFLPTGRASATERSYFASAEAGAYASGHAGNDRFSMLAMLINSGPLKWHTWQLLYRSSARC
jgi:hypothetical protein